MPEEHFTPPLDQLRDREFSFYPSIGNFETNLWRLRDANWNEFLVENQADQSQFWVPRRYLGEVSATDRPVMIVGLNRELDYRAGAVWPVQKRVITMPRPPAGEKAAPLPETTPTSALAEGLRLNDSERKVGRLVLYALAGALVLVAAVIFFFRGFQSGEMVSYRTVVQQSLGLGPEDDYFAVVRKLGNPATDRWKTDGESIQYRVLVYPDRKLNIILSGRERNEVHYIGALDADWHVVDSVNQKGGSNTYPVLSRLPRF